MVGEKRVGGQGNKKKGLGKKRGKGKKQTKNGAGQKRGAGKKGAVFMNVGLLCTCSCIVSATWVPSCKA